MSRFDLTTRTVRFFLAQYGKASLRAAVEAAARKERRGLLPGMADYCHVPIDLESITKARKIIPSTIGDTPEPMYADLLARDTGYYLRTGSGGSKLRRRFSIAHEIGHTLFLKGAKHEIGVLSKKEIETEEQICDMFASALLMPIDAVKSVLKGVSAQNPWNVLLSIENGARRMQVSLPALVLRLGELQVLSSFPLIVLCLRFFANPHTGDSPCLRVDICSSLGSLRDTRTWHNKSAAGLNLLSAECLFSVWRKYLGKGGDPTGGKYVLSDGRLVRAELKTTQWGDESILFDIRKKGKWQKERVAMQSCNCLYAAKGWDESLGYIISLLKPAETK